MAKDKNQIISEELRQRFMSAKSKKGWTLLAGGASTGKTTFAMTLQFLNIPALIVNAEILKPFPLSETDTLKVFEAYPLEGDSNDVDAFRTMAMITKIAQTPYEEGKPKIIFVEGLTKIGNSLYGMTEGMTFDQSQVHWARVKNQFATMINAINRDEDRFYILSGHTKDVVLQKSLKKGVEDIKTEIPTMAGLGKENILSYASDAFAAVTLKPAELEAFYEKNDIPEEHRLKPSKKAKSGLIRGILLRQENDLSDMQIRSTKSMSDFPPIIINSMHAFLEILLYINEEDQEKEQVELMELLGI